MSDTEEPSTLTVAQLREFLSQFPDDLPVLRAVPSDDHWGTVLARAINDHESGVTTVQYDRYHLDFGVQRRERDQQDDENFQSVRSQALLLQ